MKQHTFLAGLAVVVLLLLAACGGGGTASLASNDVAVVGGQQVTKDDLTNLLERAKKSYEAQKRPFPKPGTSAYNTLQGQAVTFLLQRAEFAQKAADMGIHISDKQIDDRINQLKKQFYNGSEKVYEQNFAALAKRYSKDPGSAAKGGQLTVTRGQTVPAFDKTAFALKKGELSHPVHTQYGWHIIQALSAIKPPTVTPLSKVKASIRQQLAQQQKNGAMTAWVDGVKTDYCKGGKVKYAPGYAPNPDPCVAVTAATSTTSTK